MYTFSYYMTLCVTTQEGAEPSMGNLMGGAANPWKPVNMAGRLMRQG